MSTAKGKDQADGEVQGHSLNDKSISNKNFDKRAQPNEKLGGGANDNTSKKTTRPDQRAKKKNKQATNPPRAASKQQSHPLELPSSQGGQTKQTQCQAASNKCSSTNSAISTNQKAAKKLNKKKDESSQPSNSNQTGSPKMATVSLSTLDGFSKRAQELKAQVLSALERQTAHQMIDTPLEVVQLRDSILNLSTINKDDTGLSVPLEQARTGNTALVDPNIGAQVAIVSDDCPIVKETLRSSPSPATSEATANLDKNHAHPLPPPPLVGTPSGEGVSTLTTKDQTVVVGGDAPKKSSRKQQAAATATHKSSPKHSLNSDDGFDGIKQGKNKTCETIKGAKSDQNHSLVTNGDKCKSILLQNEEPSHLSSRKGAIKKAQSAENTASNKSADGQQQQSSNIIGERRDERPKVDVVDSKLSTAVQNMAISSDFEPLEAKLDIDSKYLALSSSLQKHFTAAPHLLEPICKKLIYMSEQNGQLKASNQQYELENQKLTLVKDRLENLCRELQKSNNAIRIESLDLITAEQAKAKEQTAKIQSTLSGVIKLFDENQQRNMVLRQENVELQSKLKSLLEHCNSWEKSVEVSLRQRDIENRLVRTEMAKAQLVKNEEKEKYLLEKKELLRVLSVMQEQQAKIQGQEAKLRSDLSSYASKYDQCQTVISQGMSKFQLESKRMLKQLERSRHDYKELLAKYEISTKRVKQLLEAKQQWDKTMGVAHKKIETLERLCRALRAGEQQLPADDDCLNEESQRPIVAAQPPDETSTTTMRAIASGAGDKGESRCATNREGESSGIIDSAAAAAASVDPSALSTAALESKADCKPTGQVVVAASGTPQSAKPANS